MESANFVTCQFGTAFVHSFAALKLCFANTLGPDTSQPPTPTENGNLMTILFATLVPAYSVLLLLIVSAVIAIVYVRKRRRKRRSMLVKSMDRVEMKATNPQTEAGSVMLDKYIKECSLAFSIAS